MKKRVLTISFLSFAFLFFSVPVSFGAVGTSTLTTDSVITDSGTISIDWDTGDISGVQMGYAHCLGPDESADPCLLMSTTTPYTLLGFQFQNPGSFYGTTFWCGSPISGGYPIYSTGVGASLNVYRINEHCESDLYIPLGSDYVDIFFYYVPYDTRLESSSSSNSDVQYLVVIGIIIGTVLVTDLVRRVLAHK